MNNSEETQTIDFFTSMGGIIDGNKVTNWVMSFQNAILEPNKQEVGMQYSYPMTVARIIDTPNGPTKFQDALKGMIVPSYFDGIENNNIIVGQGITLGLPQLSVSFSE